MLTISCFDQGDCLFTNTTSVKIQTRDATNRALKEMTFTSINIPETGVLYTDATGSSFVLLVDPRLDQTKFVFQQAARSDTLVLGYSSQTRVLSPECGSAVYHNGLEVLYSTFSSENVIIKNQQLLLSVATNIEILY